MKLPWRKQKSESGNNVPDEVKQYYESGKRQRTSIAWLLAFSALVITVLVVFGAFLGGRWVYRKIANKSKPNTATTSQPSNKSEGSSQAPSSEENQPSSPSEGQTPAPSQTSTPQASNPTNTQQTPQSQPSSSAQNSQQQNTNLATTGPQGTAAAFVLATVVGTGFYQLKLRRKTSRS